MLYRLYTICLLQNCDYNHWISVRPVWALHPVPTETWENLPRPQRDQGKKLETQNNRVERTFRMNCCRRVKAVYFRLRI